VLFVATGLYAWHGYSLRRRAVERLALMMETTAAEEARGEPRKAIPSFPVRTDTSPPGRRGTVSRCCYRWYVRLPSRSCPRGRRAVRGDGASGGENIAASSRPALIETQLATAIYLMVGSLRAGASLLSAFDVGALEEVGAPLRPVLSGSRRTHPARRRSTRAR
jgi:hypothetical protein